MLDDAGFTNAQIVVSNDLDEMTIMSLIQQGAKVDSWGIGTKLITAYDQPALGAVYKLSAIENSEGVLQNRIKISGDPDKLTTPSKKNVYRIINSSTGMSEGEYITEYSEEIDSNEPLLMFHPIYTMKRKKVRQFEAVELLHDIYKDGKLVYTVETIPEMTARMNAGLSLLWEEYKRFLNPEQYPVDLSTKLWNIRQDLITEINDEMDEDND